MTRHQGQDLAAGGLQNRNVLRTYDLRRHNPVPILALQCGERNYIVQLDISQRPEECIAVPGDPNVAWLPRQRSSGNMAGRPPESLSVISFDDHYGEAETCDFDATDETAHRGGR